MVLQSGHLYIVATPIGNLADMSFRAIEVLQQVACVYAEDTRHSKKLLQHYNINTPMLSLHEHNEQQRIQQLMQRLQQGEDIAIISDAGTPLISDPGYPMVHQAQQAGIQVIPVPGPCALVAALSASGFATDKFIFEGFLPAKQVARCKALEGILYETRTTVFYESSHRIVDCIKDCVDTFDPERLLIIARELTKTFETIKQGTAAELLNWLQQDTNQQKGEFVLLVAGYQPQQQDISAQSKQLLKLLVAELPLKKAAKLTAEVTGDKKNQLYEYGLTNLS